MPPAELGARWKAVTGGPAEAVAGPGAALEAALAPARDGEASGPVVVAGSLYLVGAIRALLVHDPGLEPDPA
jgi:folylpolyglutamate synthase/dihydropteroate synthase